MTTKQVPIKIVTRSLLVSDVSVTVDETSLKKELAQRYPGVEQVTRWYFDNDYLNPMACVQVDFTSPEYTEKILKDRTLVVGGICRQVRGLELARCHRCQQEGHKTSDCQAKPLTEQDMLTMFEQQNIRLTALMCALNDKINHALALRYKNGQTSLRSASTGNGH